MVCPVESKAATCLPPVSSHSSRIMTKSGIAHEVNVSLNSRITSAQGCHGDLVARAVTSIALHGGGVRRRNSFPFFCDFGPDLAAKVSAGRRAEFPQFAPEHSGEAGIPDPNREETFLRSKLDWASVDVGNDRDWLRFYRALLACRRDEIVPRIKSIALGKARYTVPGPSR